MSKSFSEIFLKFTKNPKLQGTFGNLVYQHFYLIEEHKLIQNQNQTLIGIKVPPTFANMIGSVHGGALATLVDNATTLAILKNDKKLRKSVSLDLNVSFISEGKVNQTFLILSETLKVGKNVAFSEAKIYEENSLKLIATGKHLKALFNEPFDI